MKNFDIVQFIHETPIKTNKKFEVFLLKKIFQANQNVFILSCGADYLNMKYDTNHRDKKSALQPYFENPNLIHEYNSLFDLLKENHKRAHHFVLENCKGIIVCDLDYINAVKNHSKFLGFIQYPINLDKLIFNNLEIDCKIVVFLGINEWSYNQKGVVYFEKALEIIQAKYLEKVEIIITKTIPYNKYINLYNKAHILLDQTFAYDQGYNALEAMAKGKVVFTGVEKEFIKHYNLVEKVAINALPNVNYLVSELSFLIDNPNEIKAIGKRARAFVEKEHHYIKIAKKYIETWRGP